MILVTSAHMVTHGLTAMATLQEARAISTCSFIVAFMSAVLWVHTCEGVVCPSETVSLSACMSCGLSICPSITLRHAGSQSFSYQKILQA